MGSPVTKGTSAAALCVLLLSSCAMMDMMDTNKPVSGISAITVTSIDEPDYYVVGTEVDTVAGVPGFMAGTTGYVLTSGVGEEGSVAFTRKMNAVGVQLGNDLTAAIVSTLQSDGYTVEAAHITRPDKTELLNQIPAEMPGTGPILDVALARVGYLRKPLGKYYPYVVVRASLRDRDTGREIYHRVYTFTSVTSDPKFGLRWEDDVLTHPNLTIEGMKAGISAVAMQVGRDFAK